MGAPISRIITQLALRYAWLTLAMLSRGVTGAEMHYGIVVDAGSSGSRMRIYGWEQRTERDMVPDITELYNYKQMPGISDFTGSKMRGLDDYMLKFLNNAMPFVPQEKRKETPIYVMATAGMRLLHEPTASQIMEEIRRFLHSSKNPFEYEDVNTRILSGEEEGVFAWITTNYLNGFFHNMEHAQSAGILELGGASTQIAFTRDGAILANKFPVYIAGEIYPLYVHSYLSYGQEHIDRMIKETLYFGNATRTATGSVENPCMLEGDQHTDTVLGKPVQFTGIGRPDQCEQMMEHIVYKLECSPEPCGIGSIYQPKINPNQTFYALSAFLYTVHTLGVLGEDGSFTPADITEAAYKYCSKNVSVVRQETGRTDDFLSIEGMMGIYIPVLMVKGYGFKNNTRQVMALDEINGQSIEWPLGALIYENGRRDWTCVLPEPRYLASGVSQCTPTILPCLVLLLYALIQSNN